MSSKQSTTVAKAGAIAMASILLSRVIGLVRDAIVANQFGQNDRTDAYNLAFRIPDLIFYLVAGGALSSAFIPVFSEYLAKDQEEEAWKVFSTLATVMFLAVSILVGLGIVFAPQLAWLIADGKTGEVKDNIIYMGRILLPAQICFFVGSLMFATLYSKGNYTVPGIGPNVYNIGIIIGAVVIAKFVTPDVSGMCWGALGGVFIGNVIVPVMTLGKAGVKYRPSFEVSHPGVKKVFQLMLPVILGLSLPAVFMIILGKFASHYPAGINTAFDNANKIQMAPLGVFGMSLALAVFPTLSQYWAVKNLDGFREQFVSTLCTTIYLAVPAGVILLAVPDDVIRILLEHGKFTRESTERTAPILQAFAFGVLFWCMHPVVMRGYYATQDTKTPVIIGTVSTALFVGLCMVIQSLNQSHIWLGYAASFAAFLMVLAMLFALGKRVGSLDMARITRTFGQCLVGCFLLAGVMWCGFWGFDQLGSPGGYIGHASTFLMLFLVGAWGYYGATKAFGMKETATIERAMKRLERKPKESKTDGKTDDKPDQKPEE